MDSTGAAAAAALSDSQQHRLLQKLDLFRLQGRDRRGRAVLRVVGKFFPARYVSVEALTKYLEERILPRLEGREFAVVYVHTGVRWGENCPGISALRSIYDAVPVGVRRNLEAAYFVHPGLQARLFLATFGRLIFAGGLYEKIKYVNRVEFLWEEVRRKEVELPAFVHELDNEMERRPVMADSGSESDHLRLHHGAPFADPAAVSSYSMRCIGCSRNRDRRKLKLRRCPWRSIFSEILILILPFSDRVYVVHRLVLDTACRVGGDGYQTWEAKECGSLSPSNLIPLTVDFLC